MERRVGDEGQPAAAVRAVLESVPALVALVDEQHRVVYANPALATGVAAEAGALVGQPFDQLCHADDRARLTAGLERDDLRATALRLTTSTGRVVQIEATSVAAVPFEGRVVRGLFAVDVTQERQQERQLAISERMASLGTLAAGIAHEINNPLTFFATNTDLVAEKLAAHKRGEPLDVDELLELLDESRDGVRRVKKIVNSLRVFARADTSSVTAVAVEDVVEQALQMTNLQITQRARLVRDFGHPPPARANTDRLGQVLVNLLVNAVQAIPEGAKEANQIRVATRAETGQVIVEVSDTGVGISPEALPHVFDPFFTTRAVGEGTGLGLTISHRIVKEFGGELTVASEPGRGATFRITLQPATAVVVGDGPPSPAPSPAQLRVLVIDDEPLVARAITRALGGYAVESLHTGQDALERLSREPRPDVVLCDLMLPGLTGMDIFERACAADPGLTPRFLFMSGGAFTPKTREFQEAHGDSFVEKPVLPAELRDRVKQVIKRVRPR